MPGKEEQSKFLNSLGRKIFSFSKKFTQKKFLSHSFRKITFSFLLGLVIFFFVFSSLIFRAKPAQAQFIVSDVAHTATTTASWLWTMLEKGLDYIKKNMTAVLWKNVIATFLNQLAYDMADYIASGGHGQKPMFLTDPAYFGNLASSAIGDGLNALAKGGFGVDLCAPLDVSFKLNLLFSLEPEPQPPGKKCSLAMIAHNLKQINTKNMFQLSVGLREGEEAQGLGALLPTIEADSTLIASIQGQTLKNIAQSLEEIRKDAEEAFREITEDIAQNQELGLTGVSREKVAGFQNTLSGIAARLNDETINIKTLNGSCGCGTPSPSCTNACGYLDQLSNLAQSIIDKVKETNGKLGNGDLVANPEFTSLADTKKAFTLEGNPIGVAVETWRRQTLKAGEEEVKEIINQISSTYKNVTTKVSGQIVSPKEEVKKQKESTTDKAAIREATYTESVLADALGIFTNTLSSKLLNRVIRGLVAALNPEKRQSNIDYSDLFAEEEVSLLKRPEVTKEPGKEIICGDGRCEGEENNTNCPADCPASCGNGSCDIGESVSSCPADCNVTSGGQPTTLGNPSGGQTATEEMLRDFLTLDLKTLEGAEYDILTNFSVCPKGAGVNPHPDNCVMDQGMVQAISQKLSIRQAIEKGFLHKDWYLGKGPGGQTLTYDHGYSLDNVKKLRKVRILPLGFEIAASLSASDSSPITLGEAIVQFDKNSKYYHLIDQDWVLKLPRHRCQARTYSSILQSSQGNQRYEYCADPQSCLLDDESGNCQGAWGYCQKEKNIWRLGGDSCPAYYNTCQAFKTRKELGETSVAYLRNTLVGQDICNSNNVGCQWYSQTYLNNQWQKRTSLPTNQTDCEKEGKIWDSQNGVCSSDIIYFNRYLGVCSQKDEGCSEFVALRQGTNLLANSSFEFGEDKEAPLGWEIEPLILSETSETNKHPIINTKVTSDTPIPPYSSYNSTNCQENSGFWDEESGKCFSKSGTAYKISGKGNYEGGNGLKIIPPQESGRYLGLKYKIGLPHRETFARQGESFTFSFYTRSETGEGIFGLYLAPFYSSAVLNESISYLTVAPTSDWRRFNLSLVLKSEATEIDFYLLFPKQDKVIYLDALQFEPGTNPSNYSDYGKLNKIYLKAPPAYLNCQGITLNHPAPLAPSTYQQNSTACLGTETTRTGYFWQNQGQGEKCYTQPLDSPLCYNYALKCFPEEAGCEKYTPATGEPWLSGIASQTDRCPAECVGYATFKQKATDFMPEEFPLYFIPKTARTCPAQEVGCDEFTNLDVLARGGEAIENYSYLRQCEKPGPLSEVYYTWEGSDTQGYQLKVYNLIKGNPILFDGNGDGDYLDDVDLNETGSPPAYVDEFSDFSRCTPRVFEDGRDLDCKQFYDKEGHIFYRKYSKTITSSEDCHPYRKTVPVPLSNINNETDCVNKGYDWDSLNSRCLKSIFMAIPAEGLTCSSSSVGCREYIGNTGNNLRNVFENTFESGTNEGWEKGISSNEATTLGGHSLYLLPEGDNPPAASKSVSLVSNHTYLLTFFAKSKKISGGDKLTLKFNSIPNNTYAFSLDDDNPATPTVEIGPEWNFYSLGPVFVTWPLTGKEKLEISGLEEAAFFDNITLKEITNDLFLIKDSWQTPSSCDQTIFGTTSPQEMLGCQEYLDRAGQSHYLKSFSRLCREEAVGCEILIDTKNSSNPFETRYNFENNDDSSLDNVIVPKDEFVTLVNDKNKSCGGENKGCERLGLPQIEKDVVKGYTDVYVKNDPDKYQNVPQPILCKEKEMDCEEYNYPRGQLFFKKPRNNLCEYRLNVNLGGAIVSGWFKKGTNEGCYALGTDKAKCTGSDKDWDEATAQCRKKILNVSSEECQNRNGIWVNGSCLLDPFRVYHNDEIDFDNWIGECNEKFSPCTEFIDFNPNFVKNGGFEEAKGEGGAQANDPKEFITQGGAVAQDTDAYSGKSSVRIVRASDGDYSNNNINYSYLSQKIDGLKRGKTYLASVWFKAKPGVYGRLAVNKSYNSSNPPDLGSDKTAESEGLMAKKEGNGKWQKLQVTFTVPSDVSYEESRYVAIYGPRNSKDSPCQSPQITCSSCDYPDHDKINNNEICYQWFNPKTKEEEFNPQSDYVLYDDLEIKETGFPNYYYLDNDKLDRRSCIAEDWKVGCVRFLNTNFDVSRYEIIKVRPDRVCGEWLFYCANKEGACENKKNTVIICEEFQEGNPTVCVREVNPDLALDLSQGYGNYQNREVAWRYGDYSGFSIPGLKPLSQIKLNVKLNENDSSNSGNIPGSWNLCRAYPEGDSPFPNSVKDKNGFAKVNLCQDPNTSCECSYKRIEVSGQPLYFSPNKDIPDKVCVRIGGTSTKQLYELCTTDADCDTTTNNFGACAKVNKISTISGVKGWCLEYDKSMTINGTVLGAGYPNELNPCLTWYPFKTCVESHDPNMIGKLCNTDEDCKNYNLPLPQYGKCQ